MLLRYGLRTLQALAQPRPVVATLHTTWWQSAPSKRNKLWVLSPPPLQILLILSLSLCLSPPPAPAVNSSAG